MIARANAATPTAYRLYDPMRGPVGDPLLEEVRRHLAHPEPEQILHLAREDDDGDAARESDHDRMRDELDDGAELHGPEDDEEYAGHDRGDEQPIDSELLDDAVDDDDERARRAADLHA